MKVLEHNKFSSVTFKSIFLCVLHNQVPIWIVSIYVSPECRYEAFEKRLNHILNSLDLVYKTIIIGDFNLTSITGLPTSYNEQLEYHMKHNYNLCQIVNQAQLKPVMFGFMLY